MRFPLDFLPYQGTEQLLAKASLMKPEALPADLAATEAIESSFATILETTTGALFLGFLISAA